MYKIIAVVWGVILLSSCGIFRNEKKTHTLDVLHSESRMDLLKVDTSVRISLEYNNPVAIPARTYPISVDWNGVKVKEVNDLYSLVLELDSTGKRLRGALTLPDTVVGGTGAKIVYEKKGVSERDRSTYEQESKSKEKTVESRVSSKTMWLILAVCVLVLVFVFVIWWIRRSRSRLL